MQGLLRRLRQASSSAMAAAALLLTTGLSAQAAIVFYDSAASFNAAEPGLPVETSSSANLFGQPEALQASPLSSVTNGPVFALGSILAGVTISNLQTGNTPGLIVYAGGIGGSKSVGDNYFGDPVVLSFGPGVSAVGTYVFANTSPGRSLAGNFTVQIF